MNHWITRDDTGLSCQVMIMTAKTCVYSGTANEFTGTIIGTRGLTGRSVGNEEDGVEYGH